MRSHLLLTLAATTSAFHIPHPFTKRAEPEPCATSLHIIVARGSDEAAGLGKIGVIAGNVSLAIPGTTVAAVKYPATINTYASSVGVGTNETVRMVNEYAKNCPGKKIALLGYSQGAHAVMDAVCGVTSPGFRKADVLGRDLDASVIAVVTYGDPTHSPNGTLNEGTSQVPGLFGRLDSKGCAPYTDRIRGWCDIGDVYCHKGGDDRTVHGSYFAKYTNATVEYIVEQYNKAVEKEKEANGTSTEETPNTVPGSAAGMLVPNLFTVGVVVLGFMALGL